ncbi:MAG: TonB-dependent receptor [Bacteroidetes bacterium]|nr:TonB-dependent receptor [Bacteroidota bacterium]
MKLKPILFLCLIFSKTLIAQNLYSLKGIVCNWETKKPVEFCTVMLKDSATLSIKSNTFTDENGYFKFDKISENTYIIIVKFTGFKTNDTVKIKLKSNAVITDTIFIEKLSKNLKEVIIADQKPLLEIEPDKTIYNVENDATLEGLMAIDALKKMPFITVDADDNIQLKGNSNFKVLLNGKNTSIIAKNPKEALKAFPAKLIKRIEIITEPSAKYDAEGSTGIINIITYKKISGYNGNFMGSYSSRGMNNFGGSFNIKIGKLGISSYLGGNYFNYSNQNTYELYRNSMVMGYKNFLHQWGSNNNKGLWNWSNIEMSYDFDTLHTLSIYFTPGGGFSSNNSEQISESKDSIGNITEYFVNTSRSSNKNPSYDLGFDFVKIFKDNEDHEISLSAWRENSSQNSNFTSNRDYLKIPDNNIKSQNNSQDIEYTIKMDYNKPFKNKSKFETGVKYVIRNLSSDYKMKQLDELSSQYLIVPSQSNSLNYTQNVYGVYSTYSYLIKKTRIKTGLRLENTHINASFNKDSMPLKLDYLNLIPTLSISKKTGKKKTYRINYSRRVQRPWLHYLNPYINNIDPKSITYGNPNLQPEKTHNLSMSYNVYFKGNSLDISLSNSFTDDVITSFSTIDSSGVSHTTYLNVARSNTSGINISIWGMFFKKMQVWVGIQTSYVFIEHKLDKARNRSGFSNRGNGNFTWNFEKGYSASLSGWVWQSAPTLQSKRPMNYNYNLSLRKSFFKKKLNIGIVANNFLEKKQTLKTITEDPTFYQESYNRNNAFRYFSVSLSFSFGKLKENISRKKGGSNDDLKGSE